MSESDLFNSGTTDADKPQVLAIISGLSATFKALRNPYLESNTAIERMAALSWDPELTRTWIEKFRLLEGELFEDPPTMQAWKDEMYVAVSARLNTLDDLSRAACLNYDSESFMAWTDINPEVFLRPFLISSGTLAHVSGVMDSGKTDLACTLGHEALKRGFKVVTNIAFTGDLPDGLERTVRLSDLLLHMIDARIKGYNVLVLFDEVSQFFSRREPGRSDNIQLEKLLRLTRKFRSSILFIEQVRGGLTSVTLELLSVRFHKIAKKQVIFSTRNMEKNYHWKLDSVPRTKLKFKTMHMGGFRIDIDLAELFRDTLIEEEQEEALRRAILAAQNENEAGGGKKKGRR